MVAVMYGTRNPPARAAALAPRLPRRRIDHYVDPSRPHEKQYRLRDERVLLRTLYLPDRGICQLLRLPQLSLLEFLVRLPTRTTNPTGAHNTRFNADPSPDAAAAFAERIAFAQLIFRQPHTSRRLDSRIPPKDTQSS